MLTVLIGEDVIINDDLKIRKLGDEFYIYKGDVLLKKTKTISLKELTRGFIDTESEIKDFNELLEEILFFLRKKLIDYLPEVEQEIVQDFLDIIYQINLDYIKKVTLLDLRGVYILYSPKKIEIRIKENFIEEIINYIKEKKEEPSQKEEERKEEKKEDEPKRETEEQEDLIKEEPLKATLIINLKQFKELVKYFDTKKKEIITFRSKEGGEINLIAIYKLEEVYLLEDSQKIQKK